MPSQTPHFTCHSLTPTTPTILHSKFPTSTKAPISIPAPLQIPQPLTVNISKVPDSFPASDLHV
jgi:hypothetical protein